MKDSQRPKTRQDDALKGSRAIALVFLVMLVIAIGIVGAYFAQFSGGFSDKTDAWGQFGDYVGGLLNPFVALATYAALLITLSMQLTQFKRSEARSSSEQYLEEAIQSLRRAYETFTIGGANPPRNDRVMWLSTARMILRYKKIRSAITEDTHSAVADEHEEYWRFRFYNLLRENSAAFTPAYFAPSGDIYRPDVVPRLAIAVIFDFSAWRDGAPDPLDEADYVQLMANRISLWDFDGIEEFLSQYPNWEKVEQARDARARERGELVDVQPPAQGRRQ